MFLMCSFLSGHLLRALLLRCVAFLYLNLLLFFLVSIFLIYIGYELCVHNFIKRKSVKADIEIKV